MRARGVAVAGGGFAGLATALLLARDGHRVTLLERDDLTPGEPAGASSRERRGIPHFLQPHALIPRARLELRTHLPDVNDALLAAGACDVDLRRKLPGQPIPADEDLHYLAVRRPLIEWALRRAVAAETGIEVRANVDVTGVLVDRGRVTGVQVDGGTAAADLVVDALGRRTPTPTWTGNGGPHAVATTDCGVIYYARYYRWRDGVEPPDGPWVLSPRGDLGYLGFASFPGDNGTFAALLAVPTGVREWHAFKDAPVFEAAVARIPLLRRWVDPALVEPITRVLPMAGLRNTLRSYDGSSPLGLVPVGDALAHSDPVLAHGLAFGLLHAAALASALRENDDDGDALASYAAQVLPALTERYAFASALDEQRHRMWTGGPVDAAHAAGDYALFSMVAAGAVALSDADVFRVFVRRIGLLDSTRVLDEDPQMQQRIELLFRQAMTQPRPAPGPTRDEMVELVTQAGAR